MVRRYTSISTALWKPIILKSIAILFMGLLAYKILTPPSTDRYQTSPDGEREARLKQFYYLENTPSFKVYTRDTGTLIWHNQLYLPAYTNHPNPANRIVWQADSRRLDLIVEGTSIWHTVFKDD